jgi:putative transposase
MPRNLKRITGRGDLHFITFTCYQRRKFLASAQSKNIAAQILGQVRAKFHFQLVGYVLMPDHVHLLISEPAGSTPAQVIQLFKQRVSRKLRGRKRPSQFQLPLRFLDDAGLPRRFWQRRYYDFHVYSRRKLREKLDYRHANPVTEKLVKHPKDWPWSSWPAYVGKAALLPIDFVN